MWSGTLLKVPCKRGFQLSSQEWTVLFHSSFKEVPDIDAHFQPITEATRLSQTTTSLTDLSDNPSLHTWSVQNRKRKQWQEDETTSAVATSASTSSTTTYFDKSADGNQAAYWRIVFLTLYGTTGNKDWRKQHRKMESKTQRKWD